MKRIQSWLGLGVITLIKVITGLIVIKCVSYTLGPEVFGQMGQLMTLVAITSMFAGGGISNGLIQRLAASSNEQQKNAYLGAALSIYIISSSLISLLLITISQSDLPARILGRQDLSSVIILLALSQWMVGAYNLSQAVFSGYQRLRLFIIVNIIGPLLGTFLLLGLLLSYQFSGAAYGIVLLPVWAGFIAVFLLLRAKLINWQAIRLKLQTPEVKTLLSYSFLMLIAASSVSVAQIFVRDLLAENLGWRAVGYWFGVIKISDVYMQFIGMLLANYAMPIFSGATTQDNLQAEVNKLLIPLAIIAAVGLTVFYFLRHYVIILLFSKDFVPMDQLFLPQCIGDYLRILFSILSYVFIARGYRLLPIYSELFQGIALYFFSCLMLAQFGVMAPVYAHILVYTLLLLFFAIAYCSLRQGWFEKDDYEHIDVVY